jgi:hypothetical protein
VISNGVGALRTDAAGWSPDLCAGFIDPASHQCPPSTFCARNPVDSVALLTALRGAGSTPSSPYAAHAPPGLFFDNTEADPASRSAEASLMPCDARAWLLPSSLLLSEHFFDDISRLSSGSSTERFSSPRRPAAALVEASRTRAFPADNRQRFLI